MLRDNSAQGDSEGKKMGDFGQVVLVIFVIIRILIAAGLLYLVIVEARRYRKDRVKPAKKSKETSEDANGKDVSDSHGSRD